jgi:hypothetical protein
MALDVGAIPVGASMHLDGDAAADADTSDALAEEDRGVDTSTSTCREIAKCRTRRTSVSESMVLRFGGSAGLFTTSYQ